MAEFWYVNWWFKWIVCVGTGGGGGIGCCGPCGNVTGSDTVNEMGIWLGAAFLSWPLGTKAEAEAEAEAIQWKRVLSMWDLGMVKGYINWSGEESKWKSNLGRLGKYDTCDLITNYWLCDFCRSVLINKLL